MNCSINIFILQFTFLFLTLHLVIRIEIIYNDIMKIYTELIDILRVFAAKKSSATVPLISFQEYLHNYAKHYLQQQPELCAYLEISSENLLKEVKKLEDERKLEVITDKTNLTTLFIPQFFVDNVNKLYAEIEIKPDITFPLRNEIPKSFPEYFFKQITFSEELTAIKPDEKNKDFLYLLKYNNDIPDIIFPSSYTAEKLLTIALAKLKSFLIKDEIHDYMQKRLIIANPGKDFTIRSFMSKLFIANPSSFQNAKDSGDVYMLWGQLCVFVKQEFSKKNEKLPDEIALLQSIGIIEYLNNYYRNKAQKDLQSETALKNALLSFQKAPYYFTMKQITEFMDTRGVPLLGQYTEETLQNFMKEKTTASENYMVPDILSFTNSSGERFYVLAEKTVPLILSLITEARKPIRDICIKRWYELLINFEQTDAMKHDAAFSALIKSVMAEAAPNLYGLLNASFIPSLIADPRLNEIQTAEIHRIFPAGKIAPYNMILILDRAEMLNDTKILLPFWFTIPFIYAIISFFKRPVKKKPAKNSEQKNKKQTPAPQKTSLKEIAENIAADFVPAGTTFEETLQKYLDDWNQNLNKTIRNQLTEDVNALIRDYVRSVQKTLSSVTFTSERVKSLSRTLADTPSLSKIKDKKALQGYIELYILAIIRKYS